MPKTKSSLKYLVLARCDLSNRVEGRALQTPTATAVAKFIWEEIVTRHRLFGRLVIDDGPEFMGDVVKLMRKYDVNRVQISAYDKRANGMVEKRHRPTIQILARMCGSSGHGWHRHLHAVLFADRITVHGPTGRTPFSLVYGREVILPLEIRFISWRVLDWASVNSRDEDLDEIALRKRRLRQEKVEAWNRSHRLRHDPLVQGDLVLKHDTKRQNDMTLTEKLARKWLGPFRISSANTTKGYYVIEELEGTQLAGTVAANRLKLFVDCDNYLRLSPSNSLDGSSDNSIKVSADSDSDSSEN